MSRFTTLTSRIVPLPMNDIDTDQIIPARFLKVTSKEGLGKNLFADWRYDASGAARADFPLNKSEYAGAQVLLAGDNFGCGSSREHAPWALTDFGIRAVLSTSFADIFRGNALKNGLLPVVLPPELHAALVARAAATPGGVTVTISVPDQKLTLPDGERISFDLDPFAKRCLVDGVDELGFLLALDNAITGHEQRHSTIV